ncbi:hypothetical protein AMECASPLE_036654 [Ameca splendens]|uniref:Uncharacterized protein n=1 Tax=Ameca splendens TaxID=208324 RepID=A0ABV1A4N9_9TELE
MKSDKSLLPQTVRHGGGCVMAFPAFELNFLKSCQIGEVIKAKKAKQQWSLSSGEHLIGSRSKVHLGYNPKLTMIEVIHYIFVVFLDNCVTDCMPLQSKHHKYSS